MQNKESTPVRTEDGLNLKVLEDILQPLLTAPCEHISVERFTGGYSNMTYLIKVNGCQEYVLRTAPKGANVKSGHDMHREFNILKKVKASMGCVPAVYLFSDDHRVTGEDFFLMEKVEGYILRAGQNIMPDQRQMMVMADSFIRKFTEMHDLDIDAAGLTEIGFPENFITRQISGWSRRYEAARTHDIPEMETLMSWLSGHVPYAGKPGLIHNDFKYDNLIYDEQFDIKAILDWEMSTVGEPLMDVGGSLAYWADPDDPEWFRALNLNLTTLPGNPDRAAFLHSYSKITGRDPGSGVFWYAYGLLKLAVIAQQIYKRYYLGYTKEKKFAQLDKAVKACAVMAVQSIQKGRISNLFIV